MLNPVVLVRNRMLTRVVAKQAKTTKVKNKYSGVFLVEGEKFSLREKLGDKVQAKSSDCLVGSVAKSVAAPLEFAAFRSGFNVKYSRASALWFFLSTTMVFTAVRTHFARKNASIFMLIGSLSRRKK